jgi:phenylpropionate dioxygenase-like ring-hydroxylating dioxygenase large terminal subunit
LCGQLSKKPQCFKGLGSACNMNRHHAGITDDFTISHYARDMEYGYEILVENLIDPAHVPFSHSGVGGITRKSVRIGDATGVPYVQFWIQVLHSNDGL